MIKKTITPGTFIYKEILAGGIEIINGDYIALKIQSPIRVQYLIKKLFEEIKTFAETHKFHAGAYETKSPNRPLEITIWIQFNSPNDLKPFCAAMKDNLLIYVV